MTQSDREKLLAALQRAAGGLTRTQISYDVFGRHRTMAQIDALLDDLAREGLAARTRIESDGHRDKPIEMWEVISPPAGGSNDENERPVGEGWLPKRQTLLLAQRGVMPASAERVGKKIRRQEAERRKRRGRDVGNPRVSAESLGATYLIKRSCENYRDQGVIEMQGDWIRLAKNPTHRPSRHWHEALLRILAEAHPTLDGKWRRKPKKTLVAVMQDALGRPLEPHEQVQRTPGMAGSWDPEHIWLKDFEAGTMTSLAKIRNQSDE